MESHDKTIVIEYSQATQHLFVRGVWPGASVPELPLLNEANQQYRMLCLEGMDLLASLKVRLRHEDNSDVLVHTEEYRGYSLEVWQDRESRSSGNPSYYGSVHNPSVKTRYAAVCAESDSIDATLSILRKRTDYRANRKVRKTKT